MTAATRKASERTVQILAEAYKTIRSGAPGLSDQTCNVLAGIIARKVSIIYAQPHPSQQAGTEDRTTQAWADRCVGRRVAGDLKARAEKMRKADKWQTADELEEDAMAIERLSSLTSEVK